MSEDATAIDPISDIDAAEIKDKLDLLTRRVNTAIGHLEAIAAEIAAWNPQQETET